MYLSEAEEIEYLSLLEFEHANRAKLYPKYTVDLFAQQTAFMRDPAKLKAALCSRRAGKSRMLADILLHTASRWPGEIIPYIATTRGHAKRIMWKELKKRATANGLQYAENNTELTLTLSNDATIMLGGAQDESDAEIYRGNRYPLFCVDECASFRAHFKSTLEEIIEPALMDLDGSLLLAGTPGAVCAGTFFEATALPDSAYSVHKWTVLNNPFIPNAKAWLEARMAKRGWTIDTPAYQREWLGQWVQDGEMLVYAFNRERNLCDTHDIPYENLQTVCGIDLGFDDDTAFCVWGFSEEEQKCYLIYTWSKNKQSLTNIADTWHSLNERFKFTRTVVDTGGLGKQICDELRKRYEIPTYPAEKTRKNEYIELMNDDFKSKRIMVASTETEYAEEVAILQWDADLLPRKVEDSRFANHRTDAALYAYRECRHYLYKEKPKIPAFQSPDYWKLEERLHLEQMQRELKEATTWENALY